MTPKLESRLSREEFLGELVCVLSTVPDTDYRARGAVVCIDCRDVYPRIIGERLTGNRCPDCYGEIVHGIVPLPKPVSVRPHTVERVSEEEEGHSFDNAVRVLEDS